MDDDCETIVLYHYPCMDGLAALWAFGHNNPKALYTHRGINYGDPIPATCKGAHVIMLDFSFKRDQMIELIRMAKSVLVLDHHESAERELQGLEATGELLGTPTEVVFDMDRSGCRITWDYYADGAEPPQPLLWIEDRDLWRFRYHGTTRQFAAYLSSTDLNPQTMARVMESSPQKQHEYVAEGQAILRKQQRDLDVLIHGVHTAITTRARIGRHTVPAINLPHMMASDAGHRLAASGDVPFAAVFTVTATEVRISLRSMHGRDHYPEAVNVSYIAEQYGGGGHAGAAGFSVTHDYFFNEILITESNDD